MLVHKFLLRTQRACRGLSSRASAILSSLEISHSDPIPGVYDGEWKGSGVALPSVDPTTGELLGSVLSVSAHDFLYPKVLIIARLHHKNCTVPWKKREKPSITFEMSRHPVEEKYLDKSGGPLQ
jgi:hypothetical protein